MFGALFHSYVLAQMFGLYFVITGIIMLSRMPHYRSVIHKLDANDPMISLGASFGLLLGLFLIIVHNIWLWEPRLLITIICWFIAIKSLLWLAIPETLLEWSKRIYAGPGYLVVVGILLVVGVFLLTKGFYLFIPEAHLPFEQPINLSN